MATYRYYSFNFDGMLLGWSRTQAAAERRGGTAYTAYAATRAQAKRNMVRVGPASDEPPFPEPVVMTECGKRADDYDKGALTVNGHYHYGGGQCDTEPPYEMGGPA